jgi:hypothetical protein
MWQCTILLENYRGLEILHLRHYKLLKRVQICQNWNFDWMFSMQHGAQGVLSVLKKTLCMYPSNKISFTFFLAIYNL